MELIDPNGHTLHVIRSEAAARAVVERWRATLTEAQSAGDKRREQSRDVLPAAEFFVLLRQARVLHKHTGTADPLQQTVDQISANPAFAQCRLLKRILVAIVAGGDFRRAEATSLDASTHALVLALLDLREEGVRSPQAWNDAIAAVEAASL